MTARAITYLLCTVIGISMCCTGALIGLAGGAANCIPASAGPSTADGAGRATAAIRGPDRRPGEEQGAAAGVSATGAPTATPSTPVTSPADGSCAGDGPPAGFDLPSGTPPPVAAAILWAMQQLGTPYALGGSCTDPHSGDPALECDCSSLVQRAYHQGGVNLPRTTSRQQSAGVAVPAVTALKPGNLIFIPGSDGTRSSPRHVGLYIGDGLIIQAPQTGDVVKISKLADWKSQIAKMRRPVTWPL